MRPCVSVCVRVRVCACVSVCVPVCVRVCENVLGERGGGGGGLLVLSCRLEGHYIPYYMRIYMDI